MGYVRLLATGSTAGITQLQEVEETVEETEALLTWIIPCLPK